MPQNDLSTNQELFCVEYAATGNAIESYKKAFGLQAIPDDKASTYAQELLANPVVKQKIIRLHDITAPKDVLTKTQILEELSQIVRSALFPADRIRALDLLGKYYKMFSDKEQQKTYIGENKIQIIYMSPDRKTLTSQSPLRKHPRISVVSTTGLHGDSDKKPDSLESDLDSILG